MKENKNKIRIYFKDGHKDIIPKDLWDDYEYIDRTFIVKYKGAWIALYNMDVIACITVG